MENFLSNRTRFHQRILLFVCSVLMCLIITTLISILFSQFASASNIKFIRISIVIQDLLVFIFPAIITAVIISIQPIKFLQIGEIPPLKYILFIVIVMITSTPAMNWLVEWNQSLTLPNSLSSLEQWMRSTETAATNVTNILLNNNSIPSLILSIMIIGIITGFSEEIFFRGTLQRVFETKPMNKHLAIWITAFLFSLFHFQFFGFFPRMILGAFFGYLLVWSESLWVPIIAHAINNSSVVVISYIYGIQSSNKLEAYGTSVSNTQYMAVISTIITALVFYFFIAYIKKDKNKLAE